MALPASTFTSYAAIGQREDLSDIIYNIDPTDTPFFTMAAKATASAVNHEWQTDSLAAASTSNAVLEGDDATTDAATPTVRLGNICQISDKVARVTGTLQAVNKAGRDDELAYQVVKKTKELRRDMESILLSNQAKAAGNATTARALASALAWIGTNTNFGGGSGADPVALLGANTRTDGTQRAFTEAQVKDVLQQCYSSGGDPDVIMVGPFNKQKFSGFTGGATRFDKSEDKKVTAAVDYYISDFGYLKVVPNRFMRARDCLILQKDMWAVAMLRPVSSHELAKTGDSERRQIIAEYTLECRNEKSSGGVFDLTTA